MITRAVEAGAPAAWVTADEVYGQDPKLRAELARRGLGYVLAVQEVLNTVIPTSMYAGQWSNRLSAGSRECFWMIVRSGTRRARR